MESISSKNKQKIANLPNQINIAQINTSAIMYNNSKKYSLLSYKENRESIFIQTPLFNGILDIEYFKEYAEFFLQLPQNDEGDLFLTFINNLEKKIMDLAYSNKSNWFGSYENIKFRSLIKNLEDNNNKVIKFRIPNIIKARRIFVDSIDNLNSAESEEVNIKSFTTDGYIRLIININAIWFTEDTFGLYLRPVYIEEIVPFEYGFQEQNNCPLFIDSEFIPTNINKSTNANANANTNTNTINNIVINQNQQLRENNNYTLNMSDTNNKNQIEKKYVNSNIGRRLNRMNKNNSDSVSDTSQSQSQSQNKTKNNKATNNYLYLSDADESDNSLDLDNISS
jgi:hypothetical protein